MVDIAINVFGAPVSFPPGSSPLGFGGAGTTQDIYIGLFSAAKEVPQSQFITTLKDELAQLAKKDENIIPIIRYADFNQASGNLMFLAQQIINNLPSAPKVVVTGSSLATKATADQIAATGATGVSVVMATGGNIGGYSWPTGIVCGVSDHAASSVLQLTHAWQQLKHLDSHVLSGEVKSVYVLYNETNPAKLDEYTGHFTDAAADLGITLVAQPMSAALSPNDETTITANIEAVYDAATNADPSAQAVVVIGDPLFYKVVSVGKRVIDIIINTAESKSLYTTYGDASLDLTGKTYGLFHGPNHDESYRRAARMAYDIATGKKKVGTGPGDYTIEQGTMHSHPA